MITIHDFLAKLKGVETVNRKKERYNALCPAHGDEDQSLSVSRGRKGGIVLRCHAGCKTPDILHALGLGYKDIMANYVVPQKAIARYEYQDRDGNPLYRVYRYPNKDFRVRRYDGKTWIPSLGDIPKVLYNLPQISRAIELEEPIFVVEGEKDVETLRQVGVVATTNPFGAGKWDASYSESLAGAKVIIIPDYDRAGVNHFNAVRTSLRKAGVNCKAIVLLKGFLGVIHGFPRGQEEGQDVSDWVEIAGGTYEELADIVEKQTGWTITRGRVQVEKDYSLKHVEKATTGEGLKAWFSDVDAVQAICGVLGIDFPGLDVCFPGILPGVEGEAKLYRDKQGLIAYQQGDHRLALGAVYASIKYRDIRTLRKIKKSKKGDTVFAAPELAVWSTRLLVETRLLEGANIEAPETPAGLCGPTRAIWEDILLLFKCKWAYSFGLPSMITSRFLAAWTGYNRMQCSDCKARLIQLGLLKVAEKAQSRFRPALYILANYDYVPADREEYWEPNYDEAPDLDYYPGYDCPPDEEYI